jgi:hypothetical protein
MNMPILIANFLTLFAFVIYKFPGNKELKISEPLKESNRNYLKREKWTIERCGRYWISFDLFFAIIGLV